MNTVRCAFTSFRFLLVGALTAALWSSAAAAAPQVDVGSYQLVAQERFGRTAFDYTYRVSIVGGNASATDVVATLTSAAAATTVVDGTVTFGSVPAGATVHSFDTFTIRQDRRVGFDPSALTWHVEFVEDVPSNTPPVAHAGADQTVTLLQTVILNGTASTDSDGDSLSYLWEIVERPEGSAALLSDATSIAPAFLADAVGTFTIRLIVSDGLSDSAPAFVTVTVGQGNTRPVAEAGLDQTAIVGDEVQLDGSASTDLDGDALAFDWALTAAPEGSAAMLDDPGSITPTFVPDLIGQYAFRLIVSDGMLDSLADTVTVTTLPGNTPPVANAGIDQSATLGETVFLNGSQSADADDDPLTFAWSFVSRPEGSSASLTGADSELASFFADAVGQFVVQLIVSDGTDDSSPDTALITIEVGNTPPVADAGPDQEVEVGQLVVLDGRASSDPDGDPLTYSWSLTTRPAGSIAALSDPSGETTAFLPDRRGLYVGQLVVNDGSVSSLPDTVSVVAVNTAPVADAGPDQAVQIGSLVELDGSASFDADGDDISYSWSLVSRPDGSVAGLAGAATATPTFDADAAGDYLLRLVVSDDELDSEPDLVTISVSAPPPVNQPPEIVSSPVTSGAAGAAYEYAVSALDPDSDSLTFSLDDSPAGMVVDPLSGLVTWPEPVAGTFQVVVAVADNRGGSDTQAFELTIEPEDQGGGDDLPPDPRTLAPPVSGTTATVLAAATEFLYTGPDPIQTGVEPDVIDAVRAAVVRGRVLREDGAPLPGVTVSIKDNPELGQTLSRADGMFDLVVNGGGTMTVDYQLAGYLPVQRTVSTAWQDFTVADDVVLIQPDSAVTTIVAGATAMQAAPSNVVTDADGNRQAVVMFPAGTTAQMVMPDGSTQPLTTMNVRATEYTVGENGRARMPGELPPASAYTYAVDLTVDEALAAGAVDVVFNQPVLFYVDNFLGMPVGGQVPTGYYDRRESAWVPIPDGRVIRILDTAGGIAAVDSTGDGLADNGADIGMTTAELEQLAARYEAGDTLWRVEVTHFTPFDCNWPSRNAEVFEAGLGLGEIKVMDASAEQPLGVEASSFCGYSIVDCQHQRLTERLSSTHLPWDLIYASDRAPGFDGGRRLEIPLIGANVPPGLQAILLEIEVAGQVTRVNFPPLPNQDYTFTWDGRNAYGQSVIGAQTATIRVGYAATAVYALPADVATSFGLAGSAPLSPTVVARQRGIQWTTRTVTMGSPARAQQSVANWDISIHHAYDPSGRVLYLGDGNRVGNPGSRNFQIQTIAGTGTAGFSGDGGPAVAAQLNSPTGITFGSDGSLYIADWTNHRVRRITPDGLISTVAGTGADSFSGDGGPATAASVGAPSDVAVGPDGSLYITSVADSIVLRVTPDGIINSVAGNGRAGFSGDGGPALAARLYQPNGIAIGPDGSIYIADGLSAVRRVGPDGLITTVAGTGDLFGGPAQGEPATTAFIPAPRDVSIGADGSLYIADGSIFASRILRVDATGVISTIAGALGLEAFAGDGGPAAAARFGRPQSLAVGEDGSLYIADTYNSRLRRIGPDGIVSTVAGNAVAGFSGDGGPATAASLQFPMGVAVGVDGSVYIADTYNHRIRRIGSRFPQFSAEDFLVSSEDGSELYRFDAAGRHLSTLDADTGATVYSFSYDASGLLTAVTDGDGNRTTIERGDSGSPLAIVGPDGHRFDLTVDADGRLASFTNPAGERTEMRYAEGGLLESFTRPGGSTSLYTYDELGRLATVTSAEGFVQTLSRADTDDGYEARRVTAGGHTTEYAVQDLPTGGQRRTTSFADGTQLTVELGTDGVTTTTFADGTVSTLTEGPDPRFGMQSPYTRSQITSTGTGGEAKTLTIESSRSVALTDPIDPLSVETITETISRNSRTTTSVYTAATRTLAITTPAGRSMTATTDMQGRPTAVLVPGIAQVELSYDGRGRLIGIARGEGTDARTVAYDYDAAGNVASMTDPLGRTIGFEYDQAGRVTAQLLPGERRTAFDYNSDGTLASLAPPGRPAHAFTYTEGGQIAAYQPPSVSGGGNAFYAYDADRQIELVTRADGTTAAYAYDSAGRLSSLTIDRGTYGYGYSSTTGKLIEVSDPQGGNLAYSYNGALLTAITRSGTGAGTLRFAYDNDFRIQSIETTGSAPISYGYDADGLLTSVGDLSLGYDADNGLLTGTSLGTVTDNYTYNAFGEEATYTAFAGESPLYAVSYTRDELGRITRKQETIEGETSTFDYTYDDADRLEEVRRSGVTISAYAYDANGNRLSRTGDGVNETGTYDDQDRMLSYGSATFTYTANGELRTRAENGQITAYEYDELGNLMRVDLPDGTRIDYDIDGENRRVGKRVNGSLVQAFLYQDQLQPAAELDGTGAVVSRFVYGTRVNVPEFVIKGGATYRIITDQLSSPRLVVNVSTGEVVQRSDYDEFGNVTADTNPGFQPFGFAGGLLDTHTRLQRFGARDYDPATGRWLTPDPIRFEGGQTNLYTYAAGDPQNVTDPDGRKLTARGFAQALLSFRELPIVKVAGRLQRWADVMGALIIAITGEGTLEKKELGFTPLSDGARFINDLLRLADVLGKSDPVAQFCDAYARERRQNPAAGDLLAPEWREKCECYWEQQLARGFDAFAAETRIERRR